MTKMIKMSLIAAVAVTGMTSAANAQNLEDAIKGVDVSGYVDYRLENKSIERNDAASFNINEYAVKVNLKSKVNDIVTANISVGFDEVRTANDNSTTTTTPAVIAKDGDPSLNVSAANFAFVLGNTAVVAGKQDIPSVFVDKVDTTKTGAGIVASHKISDSLTVAAAHFMNNNIAADTKTSEVIAMGKIADVAVAAHYNKTDIAGAITDRTYVKVNTSIAGLGLTGKYAKASADSSLVADATVAQLIASAKLGEVSITAAYATADKAKTTGQTSQSDVAIDSDNDAESHLKVWQASTQTIANKGDVMALTVAMPLMTNVTASLTYAAATDDALAGAKDIDYTETLAQLTYKMSKNFTLHARYSMLNKDTNLGTATSSTDTDYSRVQVKYTF